MEPTEIREEVKEEFESGGKTDKWLNYLALTTVILAVCATLSSFKLEHYSVESVLMQAKASDQWAFYQSKSVKGYLYEIQAEKLELDLNTLQKANLGELAPEYKKRIDAYGSSVKKYHKEKEEIMKDAKHLEKERDEAQERREIYGKAIVFLQMAILLCSIAALLRKKSIWLIASVIGVVGIVYFSNGFLLFM